MNKLLAFSFFSFVLFGCAKKEGKLFSNPKPEDTGILFSNELKETDDLNILDYLNFYNGGGVAIGDINNDGLADIFFSGNQVKNKLYLNKGDLKFEDITEKAGVEGNSSWNMGSSMVDINGDGLLDIYVCAVVGINGFNGHNELFINKGDGTFIESSEKYGLDFDTYSSSAAFLDYDLDGDLDMYLLNHAVHTPESYGRADTRLKRNIQTGDRLLKNNGGNFVDVSEEAGIYGGSNGYGLGIAIADFNQDGYPDIYVGNDFHEDDYYYLNNGDGSFTECLKDFFGHITRFSMGNDAADINNDGWPDLMSLDMLPEDEKVLKSSEGASDMQVQKLQTERFGYHHQFSRNMLFVNQPNHSFKEIALLSGVSATDWSWSTLFADYNQDGIQDIFISNGIPRRPNDLDYINFVSSDQIINKISNTKLVDQKALDMMPSGELNNYIFKGSKDLVFENMSGTWTNNQKTISGATSFGDLDNDGDLDLVVNNINETAMLYINEINEKANYLKVSLRPSDKNPYGIGTKILSYHQGQTQYRELYTVRGFQSSSEPIIHFGYGSTNTIDSLKIIWPDKTFQTLTNVETNQTLIISPKNAKPFDYQYLRPNKHPIFTKIDDNLGIDYQHKEDGYINFHRQKLIPYQVSDRGPATAIGDLNGDGQDDIFFGGSKYVPAKVFIQKDSVFESTSFPSLEKDSIKENIVATIKDFNKDGRNDILVGNGGADFYNKMKPLLDSYYVQEDTLFNSINLPENFHNTSVISSNDFDSDGDLDIFLGTQAVSNDFGKSPISYLLENNNGEYTIKENEDIQDLGMVTDAVWDDFDNDGTDDLIVIGEWMAPTFFKNDNGKLSKIEVLQGKQNGLWQCIVPFDIDNDGDIDYLLGNWGTNSKFKASEEEPLKMFYGDFDKNGQTETITATSKNGIYYPLEGLNELAGQMISLRKKYINYNEFSGKSIEDILEDYKGVKPEIRIVDNLKSGYLKNDNGKFNFFPFNNDLQISPITAFLKLDFDKNGKDEVLVGGNYFGVKPFQGRFDSFSGALIKSENKILLGHDIGLNMVQKSVRHLNTIKVGDKVYLLITYNNDKADLYKIKP